MPCELSHKLYDIGDKKYYKHFVHTLPIAAKNVRSIHQANHRVGLKNLHLVVKRTSVTLVICKLRIS